jgi:hypothetical protein
MRAFFPSVLFATLLAGCAAQQHPAKSKAAVSAASSNAQSMTASSQVSVANQPVVVFRRTPCFGTCPHYEATIYPDGRVQYDGQQYAPVEGKRDFTLPMAVVSKIKQDAEQLGFFQLREQYPSSHSDLPSTFLIIRRPDGTMKLVQAEGEVPPSLKTLFAYIHEEIVKGLGVQK